ncbi:sigma factor-like helix-turn-helix DNA-binding protein [Delftia acidovorans]|uniref:sigma factor-like helix-turn-helix DNA-binding protein n=1 Tax=Delftia acidovorans TaxID=80866 RepID=UPI003D0B26BF
MEKMERKTLKDFNGDYSAMCAYYGRFGGLKKQKNYRMMHLIPAHKKIINLALNTELTQAQIAEATGISQGYISRFLKDAGLKRIQRARMNKTDFANLSDVIDVLFTKYLIDQEFLKHTIADNQDEIDEDYKI